MTSTPYSLIPEFFIPVARASPEYRAPSLYHNVCERNGQALQHVPEKLCTPELCSAACKQDAMALQYVPDELRTPDLCLAACKSDGMALGWVPDKHITPELCLAACRSNFMAEIYVADKYFSYCGVVPGRSRLPLQEKGCDQTTQHFYRMHY